METLGRLVKRHSFWIDFLMDFGFHFKAIWASILAPDFVQKVDRFWDAVWDAFWKNLGPEMDQKWIPEWIKKCIEKCIKK